ncbi:MAG: MBL fold metallo-hydrolase [Ferruginibacter sp.]|nr:MBL fold metallo-hydrolase [Ferruginibacter sp.]
MEIANGVHHFDCGPFNWYLIEEEGRLTLVDAGFPGHYSVYKKGLELLGKSNKDIEAIILTHAHADHIGFAEKVRKETNAQVYVHSGDANMACKPLQLPWFGLLSNAWRAYTAKMLGVAIVNGVFTLPHLTKVQTVTDGQILDVPGKPKILHTPGHTDGEIALLLEDRKILISGDTIVTRNLLTGALGQPQLTNPILNHNYKQAKRSLDLLRELGEVTMLSGHGTPWIGNMDDAVNIALENSKK